MGALLLFPVGDMDHQSYLAFAMAGLSAGAISSLAVDRVSTLGFLMPMLIPLVVRLGLEGGKLAISMGMMVMLFLIFVTMNASRGRRSLHENFHLRISRKEQKLRENEARLNQAQHTAHVGNWDLDLLGNKLSWSDEVFRIFEIDPAAFAPSYEAFLNAIHPEDRDEVNRAYTLSLETREPYELSHRLLMGDGRVKWVTERCNSFFDSAGKPLRSVGTVQDITAQKQEEHEREWQIRNQQALLDAIQESTFLMERDGTMLVVNGGRWASEYDAG
jgi:PAS domain S-box-containing protein